MVCELTTKAITNIFDGFSECFKALSIYLNNIIGKPAQRFTTRNMPHTHTHTHTTAFTRHNSCLPHQRIAVIRDQCRQNETKSEKTPTKQPKTESRNVRNERVCACVRVCPPNFEPICSHTIAHPLCAASHQSARRPAPACARTLLTQNQHKYFDVFMTNANTAASGSQSREPHHILHAVIITFFFAFVG